MPWSSWGCVRFSSWALHRYSTAYSNAESDYTDRETDKDGEDDERDSEEESCATVLTLRQDDSQAEEEDDEDDGLMVDGLPDIPSPELTLLLARCDLLHAGDSGKKAEGFQLLMENRPLVRYLMITKEMCEFSFDTIFKGNIVHTVTLLLLLLLLLFTFHFSFFN